MANQKSCVSHCAATRQCWRRWYAEQLCLWNLSYAALPAPGEPALARRQYTASLYQSYNVLLPSQPVASSWKEEHQQRCHMVQLCAVRLHRTRDQPTANATNIRNGDIAELGMVWQTAWAKMATVSDNDPLNKHQRFHCWFKLGPFCSMWIPTMT